MNTNKPLLVLMRSLAAGLCLFAMAQPAMAQDAAKAPRKDLVLKGDAVCTRCHGADEEYPVLEIGKTKHGTVADGRTPTCTSCHGASETHINRPAGVSERPKPTVVFSKKNAVPAEIQSQACLTCHQCDPKRLHWKSSMHSSQEVTCTSCHKVHTGHDAVRDKLTQPQVCFTCHKEKRVQVNKPSRHPVLEGKVSCSDCHNTHGNNPKQMIKSSVVETCYTCHLEKRGPFVHNHQPVTEDCSICHNPHGSTINGMLKSRPPFLCQDCHGTSGHRNQAAGLPTGRVASGSSTLNGTVGRGCLNCHTNIHGSNSSENNATVGRFRR